MHAPDRENEVAERIAISLVQIHPIGRLTAALETLEHALYRGEADRIPVGTVLRFLDAGHLAMTAPIAEAPRFRLAVMTWTTTQHGLMAQWGLADRAGGLCVVDPVQLGVQLITYPHMSRIVLKRLTRLWRQALTNAMAGAQ